MIDEKRETQSDVIVDCTAHPVSTLRLALRLHWLAMVVPKELGKARRSAGHNQVLRHYDYPSLRRGSLCRPTIAKPVAHAAGAAAGGS